MTGLAIGTGRAVEVLHDRGPGSGADRWTGGSGYLIGSRLVLTAAHNVDYRRDLGADEQLLVRTIEGDLLAARVVLAGEEQSGADLAVLEISDPGFGGHLLPVTFARVDRDSPAPVKGCWAVGFPRFGEAGPALPGGSRRETWQVSGHILPGGKRRTGLLSLEVTSTPRSSPASLAGSEWEGMSGAVVFAGDGHDGEQAAVGVITAHHPPEGESALTVVPITAAADLAAAPAWWQQLRVDGPGALPVLPRRRGKPEPLPAGWPLAEVRDAFALEVHRPIQPDGPRSGLPELPAYLPRDHDAELARVVRGAAEGRSGIATLVGGSSTGKTRACWEALQLLRDQQLGWRLWHPIDPTRPEAALRELPGIGPRTVVWLNEAQFYLDPAGGGLGERVAAGLRELLRDPARAPVLVLATLWPRYWDDLTARPPDGGDPHAQARELLAGHDIHVPAAFTPAQLGQLSRAGDARLALAAAGAQDGQVIQFLAGAPELLARYRNAPPAAKALISAAMDARRLGAGIGLPQAFLEAAAPGYLTDDEWDALGEDWLEQALTYAAKDAKGVRGPLTRIRPRPAASRATRPLDSGEQLAGGQAGSSGGPLHRLADYLDQHGRTHRKGQFPPAGFWAAAAACASPADQAALGDAAHARGLYRVAAQLQKNAAARGNPRAVSYFISPPDCLRADESPLRWAAARMSLDDPRAVAWMLGSLRRAGARDQAAALAARAAARVPLDDPGVVAELLDSLPETGAEQQVAVLLGRDPAAHMPLDDTEAVTRLLINLLRAGAQEQFTVLFDRVSGRADAMAALLNTLLGAGAQEQAAALLSREPAARVRLDDEPHGVAALLDSLRDAGAQEQAAALLSREPAAHASLDNAWAVAALLGSLREAGAQEQFTALAARVSGHAPLDNLRAVAGLLASLRDAGAQEQAAALAARAAARAPLDDPRAVAGLLNSLREAGAPEQAAALLGREPAAHASLDDPGAVATLLNSLRDAGAPEQAAALLGREPAAHASLDNPYAVAGLLASLRDAGAQEQAVALADRAAAPAPPESPEAVAALLDSLRRAGAQQQAAALAESLPRAGMFELFLKQESNQGRFRFGREADGSPAEPWAWDDLE